MKKTVAGVLVSLFLCIGYESFAAFPSFVASAAWSSNLIPDPDYVDETDVDFFAASPDFISTDEEMVDVEVPEEPVGMMPEKETPAEEPRQEEQGEEVQAEEEPLVVTQPDEEEQIPTPDKAVEDEVID